MPASFTWQDGASGGTSMSAANFNKLAVVADLGVAGTPTGDAAKAAYAAAGMPSHAGARAGRFDTGRSIYNAQASNTRRLRGALSAARAGTGLCRITFVGDSLTAGYGGDPPTPTPAVVRGTSDAVTFLRSELTRQSYTTGELVQMYSNTTEPRVSKTGGPWGQDSALTFPWLGNDSVAGTLTLSGTGTVCEIVTTSGGDSFTYSIDGGTAQTFTPNPATPINVVTVTGLTAASHTLTITAAAGKWAYVYAAGFRSATGVVLHNAGLTSSTTTHWLDTSSGGYGPAQTVFAASNLNADAVLIELGANNIITSGTVANFRTDLGTLVDQARAQAPSNPATVVLVTSNYMSGRDATWPPYLSAIYDVADSKGCAVVDFADRLGLFSQYSTSQGSGDGVHLNPAGTAHKARAWWNALAA